MRLLAITGDNRLGAYPAIPTVREAGFPQYKAGTTYGIYVPGGTSTAVEQKLHGALNRGLKTPEVLGQLQKLGIEPTPKTTEEFAQWYLTDLKLWKDIVARAKIPPLD